MIPAESSPGPLTALVLAASRKGIDDPVARLQNKSHKCLVSIDGVTMIERVIQTLLDSECFGRILVSIEDEQVLQDLATARCWLEAGTIEVVPSSGNLADSLINLSNSVDQPLPLVITAADNALHTPELVRDFVTAFERGTGDAAVAVTTERTVLDEYPGGKFGFFQFRDGGYSFCNLFGVSQSSGLEAAKIFRTGGQFRKRPWRMLKIFGPLTLILYKWRLLELDSFVRRATRKFGVTIDLVRLPYAFAPIDVDNPTTFEFSERTLRERRGAIE
jgi:GTP:adenosylcobinamide-phosphate guanylyltransferase